MEMLAIYKGHSEAVEGVSQATGNAWRKVTAIFETIEHYPKRMRTHHHRLTKEEAQKDPDVRCMAMRLACLDWLKACITQGRKPSDILTPLIDQASYAEYRRTCP